MTRTILLLLTLVAVVGCASYRGITPAQITPRTTLRVHLTTQQTLRFRAPGDSLAVADVIEVTGRMVRITSDSITITATAARRVDDGIQRFGAGATTTLAIADARFVEVQQHPGRTIALVVAVGLAVALLIAIATYEEPPPPPPPPPKNK